MKLLRVKATNFKNCINDIVVDFVAKSKKTAEDKEYELQEIDKGLYVYNTMAFIGKNASGKTTVLELLDCCYDILGDFRLEGKHYDYTNINLEIIFYEEGYIYRYCTVLQNDISLDNKAVFIKQRLMRKKYYKTKLNSLYTDDFIEQQNFGDLPEDTSILFFVLKRRESRALYFDSYGNGIGTYQLLFKAMKSYRIDENILSDILTIFDENIKSLEKTDEHNYKLKFRDKELTMADRELIYFLSSGTTKGILLYVMVVASLKCGFDLIVDEIENHFHKTLVENIVSLYKDKSVNKNNATLIFSTHYCEILDLFNRQDNIWICKTLGKIVLENMYLTYAVRNELLKSRQFYNNAFQTSVNYEALMQLKGKLIS